MVKKHTGTSVTLVWIGVQNKKTSLNVKDVILSEVLAHLAWDDDIKLSSIFCLSRSFIADAFWSRVQTEYHCLSIHLKWQMGKTFHPSCMLWPKHVLEKTVKCVHIGYHITTAVITTPRLDCNPYHIYISNSFLFSGVSLLLWRTLAAIPDCCKATRNLASIGETVV